MRNYKSDSNGLPISISDRLIFLRHEKGITLEEVAKLFKANKSAVSRWESEDHWIDSDTQDKRILLMKLAEHYQADYDWVLNGKKLHLSKNSNIMIVDDETTSLTRMTLIIKSIMSSQYQLFSFSNPNKALLWAKSNPSATVFCDYRMPDMKGDEFVKKLRMIPTYNSTLIVAVTQVRESGIKETMLSAGADYVVQNPLDEHELEKILQKSSTS